MTIGITLLLGAMLGVAGFGGYNYYVQPEKPFNYAILQEDSSEVIAQKNYLNSLNANMIEAKNTCNKRSKELLNPMLYCFEHEVSCSAETQAHYEKKLQDHIKECLALKNKLKRMYDEAEIALKNIKNQQLESLTAQNALGVTANAKAQNDTK